MSAKDYKIAIVYNLEQEINMGEPQDLVALEDTASTAQHLYEAMLALGYNVDKVPAYSTLDALRLSLKQYSPKETFIFNNTDGFNGVNIGSVLVTRAIEDLGFSHTGSPPEAIEVCTDKVKTKKVLTKAGVPTPPYQIFTRPEGDVKVCFPAIVKPAQEDGSVGIELKSVVNNDDDLFDRVAHITETYKEPALVEEFIAGREMSISVWGNGKLEAMPVYEQDYSLINNPLEWLLTFESKWNCNSFYYNNITSRCPADIKPEEASYLQSVAVRTFQSIGLRDFGRVDMRYKDGKAYVVDINDIPDLSPDSGFPRTAAIAGYDYNSMVQHMLELAMKREGWI
jgi:D-alanine-D-alanine ligase